MFHITSASLLDTAFFLAGAVTLGLGTHHLLGQPERRVALAYAGLVLAFFALPLATDGVQVPTDIAYPWLPWRAVERTHVRNPLLGDLVLQMLPWRTAVRERLLAGEAPLWSHEMGTGQALLGNGQSAPFAPLHLAALPLPPLRAMTVSAAWQVLVGLLLMHALAAELGVGAWSAAFAAIGFAFSTFSIAWL